MTPESTDPRKPAAAPHANRENRSGGSTGKPLRELLDLRPAIDPEARCSRIWACTTMPARCSNRPRRDHAGGIGSGAGDEMGARCDRPRPATHRVDRCAVV